MKFAKLIHVGHFEDIPDDTQIGQWFFSVYMNVKAQFMGKTERSVVMAYSKNNAQKKTLRNYAKTNTDVGVYHG